MIEVDGDSKTMAILTVQTYYIQIEVLETGMCYNSITATLFDKLKDTEDNVVYFQT